MPRSTLPRNEARRVRRGRQPSHMQGQGHGKRKYVRVRMTNDYFAQRGRYKAKADED